MGLGLLLAFWRCISWPLSCAGRPKLPFPGASAPSTA